MNIAITSQNLNPKIVVSGISTVVATIIKLSHNNLFFYEMGYRDGESKNFKWLLKQIKFIFHFPFFLLKNNIDLVHLNVPFDTMGIIREYMALLLSKLVGKKILLHIHGGKLLMIPAKGKLILFLIKRILNDSNVVLVLSQIEKDILNNNYNFNKAKVLLNAVDTSTIEFNQYKNAKDKVHVLYMARITESKGIDDLIVAFRQLYPISPFKFFLCGTGSEKEYLISCCQEIFGDDFVYKGVVSGSEKWNVIASSDIFILPSRHSEGLPMSLLETMAAGLVPIVTDEASMKYVVTPGINGVRVKKYNGLDICNKLNIIMNDHKMMMKFSKAARQTVEREYDTISYINKLDEIYYLLYNS